MLLAGYETSANLLAFAVYSLAKHPAKAAKLQAELDDVKALDPEGAHGTVHLAGMHQHSMTAALHVTGTGSHSPRCGH